MGKSKERRRATRVRAEVLIAVRGVDADLQRRPASVSDSGIYFEHEQFVGAVGSIQWVRLDTTDRDSQVGLIARVVRTLILTDADHRRAQAGLEQAQGPDRR